LPTVYDVLFALVSAIISPSRTDTRFYQSVLELLKPQTHDQQMLANTCWPTFLSHTTTFCWTTVWRRWQTQQTTTLLQQ